MESRQKYLQYLKQFVQSGGAICKENKETFAILEMIKGEIEFLLDNKFEVKYGMRLHSKKNNRYKKTWTMCVNKYYEGKLTESLIIFQIHLDHFDKYILEWKDTKEYNLDEQGIINVWHRETQSPDGYFINSLARIYCNYIKTTQNTKSSIGFINIFKEEEEEEKVLQEAAKVKTIKTEKEIVKEEKKIVKTEKETIKAKEENIKIEEEAIKESESIKQEEPVESKKKVRRTKKNKEKEEEETK